MCQDRGGGGVGGRLAALCFSSARVVPLQQNSLAIAVWELSEYRGGTETLGFGRKGHVDQKVKQASQQKLSCSTHS